MDVGSNVLDAPGIYEWRIAGTALYVGKAKRLKSRLGAYPRNVRDVLLGRSWHGQEGKAFRPVHYGLRQAHDEGAVVVVAILENCDAVALSEREHYWIKLRRGEEARGGPIVLNAT
ncbi:MAG: hypothetical protein ACWA6X_06000 [Bauldia sp.]